MTISSKLKKSKIGVLMGGNSSERAISIKSGKAVAQALKKAGLEVVAIDLKGNQKRAIQKEKINVAFLTLHGQGGEDGKIQSLLESMKIPYVGSDSKSSASMFNKWKAKQVFLKNKIPTPRAFVINKRGYKTKLKNLIFPLFVKPLEEGSSIGVRLLNDRRTVEEDMAAAMKDYDKLMVEDKIFGKEISIGILGNQALPIIELDPKNSFYDYEAKYKKGMTRFSLSPNIPKDRYEKYQKLAVKTFKALKARDMARVDMIVDSMGEPFVLEVNSLPGFTEQSLLPMAAQKMGMDFTTLCITLLNYAVKRRK